MPFAMTEKIARRHAAGAKGPVRSGDYLTIRPKHVMSHDNTGAIIPKFEEMGAGRMANPRQPVFCLDHDIQNTTEKNLAKYAKIEAFAKKHGVDFYPAGRGIGHQVMVEEGYATPGALVVASDSHSNLYGAVGALGTPVVRADAAAIWSTGETWWQVPPLARARLTGELRPGCSAKDVIVALCGVFNKDEVLNHVVEFTGPGVAALDMEGRLTIANMTTEWGALAGVFPRDEITREYYMDRVRRYRERGDKNPRLTEKDVDAFMALDLDADEDAVYAVEMELDLSTVSPCVSGPNEVKTMASVADLEKKRIKVHKAYLLSCVNARLGDLRSAAKALGGRKVADHVEFYVAAASSEVQANAEADGTWKALAYAGAKFLPPGCGPCIGLGEGTLGPNEVGISATNRNFKGRMGDRSSLAYLASPAVVASSAVAGYIAGSDGEPRELKYSLEVHEATADPAGASADIIEGFPREISGRVVYLPKDNLNTDGIYGGAYTYRDDMTPEEMAKVIFLNYEPDYPNIGRAGDIVVGGKNFGSGSSREQAATALMHAGIRMVIAESLSQTYQRNAFNNGFVALACPGFVKAVRAKLQPKEGQLVLTDDDAPARVDFAAGVIEYAGQKHAFGALSDTIQQLVVAGGVEGVVKEKLAASGASA